jgi:hypothetical protein
LSISGRLKGTIMLGCKYLNFLKFELVLHAAIFNVYTHCMRLFDHVDLKKMRETGCIRLRLDAGLPHPCLRISTPCPRMDAGGNLRVAVEDALAVTGHQ